jgi:hypothetical protein
MDLENYTNISEYYSSIDKHVLDNLYKDEIFKNLIKLSTVTDIYLFNKKNQNWYVKTKTKLLKECDNSKKKEIKYTSSLLSNLAKLNKINDNDFDYVKNIYRNLEDKIDNIDKFINYINNIDMNILLKKNKTIKLDTDINYIAYYCNS